MVEYNGIKIRVLGDSSPFSKTGKSSGYLISIKDKNFLVDCGAPIFQILDKEIIDNLDGVIITHLHDDHKRWFTDLALYRYYVTKYKRRIKLLTSEPLLKDLRETSINPLQRTLSPDSTKSIDVPYDNFIEEIRLGPKAKFRIDNKSLTTHHDGAWRVMNQDNDYLSPEQAKVIIHPETFSKRMLFNDPMINLWIEPESFYPFDSKIFYEDNRIFEYEGIKIEAFKSHNWHGLTGIGIKISTENESVFFSGDTIYNLDLFEKLAKDVRDVDISHMQLNEANFTDSHLIIGDINDFIQKTWSDERLDNAKSMYEKNVVFHEATNWESAIHTNYKNINSIKADEIILVHTPDHFVSNQILTHHDKVFVVIKNNVCEQVDKELFVINADYYYRNTTDFFVGFISESGEFKVIEKEHKLLDIISSGERTNHKVLCRINLFQDIQGKYFEYLLGVQSSYRLRDDGKVEKIITTETGSFAKVVKSIKRVHSPFSMPVNDPKKSDTGIRYKS
ncbi:MAG: MBL fold metallo-hydrolase [Planctomycetes bacterium]|nr:MBL fold metallo-hydrolase [Planctomycetota bacterium]